GEGRHGENDFSMFTINLKTTKKIWRNAVAFSWSKAKDDLAKVVLRDDGEVWKFHTSYRTVELNWANKEAKSL
ncbi:MAG: hypothetical protein AAB116_14505, partial [Candidatus Poribacteria bacterium]